LVLEGCVSRYDKNDLLKKKLPFVFVVGGVVVVVVASNEKYFKYFIYEN
jgi:hypothetical protein